MHREILIACLPHLLAIGAAICGLRLLVGASGARLQLARLRRLPRDQTGAVQSLSFVLTLPVFIMLLMFIVQWSQVLIARIVVEYAAFAAARSAIVWIPANLGAGAEQENRIGRYQYLGDVTADDGYLYSEYQILPEGPKFNRIQLAAVMACLSVCPSRDVGTPHDLPGNAAAPVLWKAYAAYAPSALANPQIPARLANKLAYSLQHTRVEIRVRHKDDEPELARHDREPYPEDFTSNEIGWQDQLVVTVRHDFAMLPGPGRLLARTTAAGSSGPSPSTDSSYSQGSSQVTQQTSSSQRAFTYPLSATVRLNNEGEKPVLPYVQRLPGQWPSVDPPGLPVPSSSGESRSDE
ncbi:MAG: pilus assembly protein [Planctomycetota bacterium]|nr:pilus assembly protein [Planctomycetota bacterium]